MFDRESRAWNIVIKCYDCAIHEVNEVPLCARIQGVERHRTCFQLATGADGQIQTQCRCFLRKYCGSLMRSLA